LFLLNLVKNNRFALLSLLLALLFFSGVLYFCIGFRFDT